MTRRRTMVGVAIIGAWLIGLGLLVRREYFQPQLERLAEAAGRIAPGVVFYGVMQGDRQVGFASSTIDTAETTISVIDYLVADIPMGGKARRATARTNVTLSRALRMTRFDLSLDTEGAPVHAAGRVDGDSVLVLGITSGGEPADSQRIALAGPILLPTLVPLAVALTQTPKIGRHYVLPVLNPATMSPQDVGLDVRAESLFVIHDSAVFDPASKRWSAALPDTIRAWKVVADSQGAFSGWVDAQGRIVETTQLGFALRRLPYEVAWYNWRADSNQVVVTEGNDVLETTAIAANKRMDRRIDALRVRLTGVNLSGFDLDGQNQRLRGDTLLIRRAPDSAMVGVRRRDINQFRQNRPYLRAEPLIQSSNPVIVQLAARLRGQERDPRVIAERINRWVHDSIADRITFGVPSALNVLASRTGDCNEHTQLFVALARAVGLPARVAAGLAYVDGKFYYHAWPEILLTDWVPVDPTFGQFPADAAHLRFTIGGLTRQTELLRLMGNLKIDVLAVNGGSRQ